MLPFFYFIPDSSPSATALKALATMLEAGSHVQGCNGPDGRHGQLVAAVDRCEAGQVRYVPDEQTWADVSADYGLAAGSLWCGFTTADRPGPESLLRSKVLAGHFVELADGNAWLVGVARGQAADDGRHVWYHTLPRAMRRGAAGWEPGPVIPRWARLWQIACDYWEARTGVQVGDAIAGQSVSFDFSGAGDAAAIALGSNFRIGAAEIGLLGLFDTESPRKILDAVIDWPTFVRLVAELEQKKTAEGAVPPAG